MEQLRKWVIQSHCSNSESGPIEYNIPGTLVDYINLSKTKVHIKYVITTEKEVPIQDIRGIDGKSMTESEQVTLTFLYIVFLG